MAKKFNVTSDNKFNPQLKEEIQGLRGLMFNALPKLNKRFEAAQCPDAPQLVFLDLETGKTSEAIGLCNCRGFIEALNWLAETPKS